MFSMLKDWSFAQDRSFVRTSPDWSWTGPKFTSISKDWDWDWDWTDHFCSPGPVLISPPAVQLQSWTGPRTGPYNTNAAALRRS